MGERVTVEFSMKIPHKSGFLSQALSPLKLLTGSILGEFGCLGTPPNVQSERFVPLSIGDMGLVSHNRESCLNDTSLPATAALASSMSVTGQ
jgi:hypothetical protein